jgi:hypothetical protein
VIIGRLPRRLRPVLGITRAAPAPPVASPAPTMDDFVAYAADCRIFGQFAPAPGRLSDLLNSHDEYELVDVQLESLADGHVLSTPVVLAARDELIAVHTSGSSGPRARRTNTRPWPIVIRSEPYLIRGYLHVLPGADPIASFRHRKPMIPLTDAWIEYMLAGKPQRLFLGTVVVNRELVNSFMLSVSAEVEPPELPAGAVGPLTKDFTGTVLGRSA